MAVGPKEPFFQTKLNHGSLTQNIFCKSKMPLDKLISFQGYSIKTPFSMCF
jgi:hypothetical protein